MDLTGSVGMIGTSSGETAKVLSMTSNWTVEMWEQRAGAGARAGARAAWMT